MPSTHPFYTNTDDAQRTRIDERVKSIEAALWTAVGTAAAQPTPVAALVLAGMNDVTTRRAYAGGLLESDSYGAWYLCSIALCCNVLCGYRMQTTGKLALVLPPSATRFPCFDRRNRCSAAWTDTTSVRRTWKIWRDHLALSSSCRHSVDPGMILSHCCGNEPSSATTQLNAGSAVKGGRPVRKPPTV